MAEMSGRKYIVVASVSTYCLVIVLLGVLAVVGKCPLDVFLASFSGLGSLVMYFAKAYFDDKDRPTTQNQPTEAVK